MYKRQINLFQKHEAIYIKKFCYLLNTLKAVVMDF